MVRVSGVIKYGVSDHDIVYVVLKKEQLRKDRVTFECRDLTNYSRDDLIVMIDNYDWIGYYTCDDVDTCWHLLYDAYIRILNHLTPLKRLKRVKSSENWTSLNLFRLIRERDRLKTEADNETNSGLKNEK